MNDPKPRTGGPGPRPTVMFPDLIRQSTFSMDVVLVSGIVGAVLLARGRSGRWALVFGIVASIPWVFWVLSQAFQGIWNTVARYQWSRQFPARINCREVREMVSADPGRYVLHVRTYAGFDTLRLTPAAILEDQTTGDLVAVYPSDGQVTDMCEEFHVQVVAE